MRFPVSCIHRSAVETRVEQTGFSTKVCHRGIQQFQS